MVYFTVVGLGDCLTASTFLRVGHTPSDDIINPNTQSNVHLGFTSPNSSSERANTSSCSSKLSINCSVLEQ